METKEIILPDGWEVNKIENGKIILKESEKTSVLPNSWEEYCNCTPLRDKYYINSTNSEIIKLPCDEYRRLNKYDDRNIIASEARANAFLALMQLANLHDEYVKGFEFDNWDDGYYSIARSRDYANNEIIITYQSYIPKMLCFPNRELAEKFYNNFKDLIEIAKELL